MIMPAVIIGAVPLAGWSMYHMGSLKGEFRADKKVKDLSD